MRFLICGSGSVGRRHLRNLQALGERDIVLYRTGLGSLRDNELEGIPAEDDLEAALDRWAPAAVLVTNPTALHLEVALPAARAGCHLFIEKPVSDTLEGLDDLQVALTRTGGQALVGYQYRFHPGLRRARELIAAQAIGRPLSARAHWGEHLPDWHPWEDYRRSYSARAELGGGALLTLSHPFDYLRFLFGEVDSVTGAVSRTGALELNVEDTAEVALSMRGEILASVHLNYNQRPPAHWLEVVGTRGTLRWNGLTGLVRWWNPDPGEWSEEPPPPGFERNSMFIDEMRHFIEVARGDQPPVCTLRDGIRATEIALAAAESAASGARVALQPLGEAREGTR